MIEAEISKKLSKGQVIDRLRGKREDGTQGEGMNKIGGLGARVSGFTMIREISKYPGWTGYLSGTGLATVLAHELQNGDEGAKEVLLTFPNKDIADQILDDYWIPGGKPKEEDYRPIGFPRFDTTFTRTDEDPSSDAMKGTVTLSNKRLEALIVAANFVEVRRAKQGHTNIVGINYLRKIGWTLIPSLYGAELGGADFTGIGAASAPGIQKILTDLAEGRRATLDITREVQGRNPNFRYEFSFDPREVFISQERLVEPAFISITSREAGILGVPDADGYTFAYWTAAGHGADPRQDKINHRYGPKDDPNFEVIQKALARENKPWWMAGNRAHQEYQARKEGATGIQVGSLFAYASLEGLTDMNHGMDPKLRREALEYIRDGGEVSIERLYSPARLGFKVLGKPRTLADTQVEPREPCKHGYLGTEYADDKGQIKIRCPAEPTKSYEQKGGNSEDTEGKVCLCNGLLTTIDLANVGGVPILTAGVDLTGIRRVIAQYGLDYRVGDVVESIEEQRQRDQAADMVRNPLS